jgi:chromosome segregation ATPase
MKRNLMVVSALLLAAVPTGSCLAQKERTGSAGNAQLLQQLQSLASERTSLQADNARLKGELDKQRKELDALKATQGAAGAKTRAVQADATRAAEQSRRTDDELAQTKARLQELVGRFRETATQLRDAETSGATLKRDNLQIEQQLASCSDRNAKLVALNGEILTHMEDEGFWTAVARREPFTRLARTRLENLVDDYHGKAEDLRAPQTPATPAAR